MERVKSFTFVPIEPVRLKMRGFLHIRQKRHFQNKIKMSKKEKDRLVGGRVTWMEQSNNTKIFRNTIKAGSVFLKSSTAHHHPDEFCQEKRNNISISSEEVRKNCTKNICSWECKVSPSWNTWTGQKDQI